MAKNTLRILTLERLGETFNQQSCPLRYTPRKFIIHPEHKVSLQAKTLGIPFKRALVLLLNIDHAAIASAGGRHSQGVCISICDCRRELQYADSIVLATIP